MTENLAEFDYSASFYEVCVVFNNFKYRIQFNFKAIEGFQARLWIREDDKFSVFAMTNEIHGITVPAMLALQALY